MNPPDVLYIGNMRSGSTFVRSFMDAHPDVFWTRKGWYLQQGSSDTQRRTTYWGLFDARDARCHVDMYESLFMSQYFRLDVADSVPIGEGPHWDSAWAVMPDHDHAAGPMAIDPLEMARRVADCLPEGKVLIVIREQVAWMRSMYMHHLSQLPRGRRSLRDFLTTLQGQAAWNSLRYDHVISAYRDAMGSEHLHVLLLEQLKDDPASTLGSLYDFLGVRRHPFDIRQGRRNEGPDPRLAMRLRSGRVGALRRVGQSDLLTPDEVGSIRAEAAPANRRLAEILDLDIEAFGYAVS